MAQLAPTDRINWSAVGPPETLVASPFTITTDRGMLVNVSTGGTPPTFKRLDEGVDFSGDFLPGTPLLATNSLGSTKLHFPTPVFGAGAYIQHRTSTSFIAYVLAKAGATTVAEYTISDTNDHLADGSATFIGVLCDQAIITDIYFDSYYGMNTVTAEPAIRAVPEPGSAALLGLGIAGLLARRRRSR